MMSEKQALWQRANALKSEAQDTFRKHQWDVAYKVYAQALEIYSQIGVLSLQGRVLHEMGWLAEKQGQLSDAQRHYEQALALKIVFPNVRQSLLHALARLSVQQGNAAKALDLIPQIWDAIKHRRSRGWHASYFKDVGDFADSLEAYDLAVESYQQALEQTLTTRFTVRNNERATLLYHLGQVARKQGQYDRAWDLYAQALRLCVEGGFVLTGIEILWSWALLEQTAHHRDTARRLLRLACTQAAREADDIRHGIRFWDPTCSRLLEQMQPDYLALQCDTLDNETDLNPDSQTQE